MILFLFNFASFLFEHCKLDSNLEFVDIVVLPYIEKKVIQEVHNLLIFDNLGPKLDEGEVDEVLELFDDQPGVQQESFSFDLLAALFTGEPFFVTVVYIYKFVVHVV